MNVAQKCPGVRVGGILHQRRGTSRVLSNEFPKLQHLHLAETQVTDRCLESITKFKCLRTLVVEGAGISKAGVAEIQNALPACEILPDEDW